MNKTTRFDAVDYLQDEQDIAIYLEEAAKQAHAENDTGILLDAISVAAKARGMMQSHALKPLAKYWVHWVFKCHLPQYLTVWPANLQPAYNALIKHQDSQELQSATN